MNYTDINVDEVCMKIRLVSSFNIDKFNNNKFRFQIKLTTTSLYPYYRHYMPMGVLFYI